jgi:Rha family phage regulatory protein
VANVFEKRHDNVLRDIRELQVSKEFSLFNFEESKYKDERGKKQPEYLLTKDGFIILCMGYNGEKAMIFKEAYIKRFNEMEAILKEKYIAKGIRRELTDVIKDLCLNDQYHGHAYSLITDLIYKYSLGKSCKKMKEELELDDNDNLRDHLTSEQSAKVKKIEKLVNSYLDLGFNYGQVKESIEQNIEMVKQLTGK